MVDKTKVKEAVKTFRSEYELYILDHADSTEQAISIIRELRYEASEDRKRDREDKQYLESIGFGRNKDITKLLKWEE